MIPVPPNEGWTLFTAAVPAFITGVLAWLGGDQRGVKRGQERFLNAVQEAASMVIEKLEAEVNRVTQMHAECAKGHEDCKSDLACMQSQIDALMAGGVASYQIGQGDGK